MDAAWHEGSANSGRSEAKARAGQGPDTWGCFRQPYCSNEPLDCFQKPWLIWFSSWQVLKAAEKHAEGSGAAHNKTKVCNLQSISLSRMRVRICCPAAVLCTPVIGSLTKCVRESTSKTGMVFRDIMQLS